MKGFNTGDGYMGLVNGKYIGFEKSHFKKYEKISSGIWTRFSFY